MRTLIRITVVPVLAALLVSAGCVSMEATGESSDEAADTNYQLGAQYYRNGSFELARARLERAVPQGPPRRGAPRRRGPRSTRTPGGGGPHHSGF